ncbi:MAG: polyphosphate kinase 1 [Gemmatimonadales bacterium]
MIELRWDVESPEVLHELLSEPLPLGLPSGSAPPTRTFYRDVYFDTVDGDLRKRDITCRLRFDLEDRRWLALRVHGRLFEAAAAELEPVAVFAGTSGPARRLRALVDPGHLLPRVELETERHMRAARWGVLPVTRCVFAYDHVTVRAVEGSFGFQELVVRGRRWALPPAARLASAIETQYALRPVSVDRRARAEELMSAVESEHLARAVHSHREVAVIAVERGRVALCRVGNSLRLPLYEGSGEEGCREIMRRFFGSPEGQLRLLGTVPAAGARPAVEVWAARRVHRGVQGADGARLQWFTPADVIARVGSPILRDPRTLAALTIVARSDLLPEWSAPPPAPAPAPRPGGAAEFPTDSEEIAMASRLTLTELRVAAPPPEALDAERPAPEQFINAELSHLEFNSRVLALAEDPATPPLARLRFLAIFSTNLDQFFMVRVGALKHAVAVGHVKPTPDGLSPHDQLDAIAVRLRPQVERQYRCFNELRRGVLATHGVRIRAWAELDPAARAALDPFFRQQVFPLLTPKALTRSPGHPFPYIRDGRISLALVLRDTPSSPVHYVHLEVPDALPRFVPLPSGGGRDFVPVEEVLRGHLHVLYPGRVIVESHTFRITRSGDIQLDELGTANFVQAIEEEVRRRALGPVVRIEVERSMPQPMRDLLHREFRYEESEQYSTLSASDVYEAEGIVDLGALHELTALPVPDGDYRPFTPAEPFAPGRRVFDILDERDVLVHHPYDSFEATFERFIEQAAEDVDVLAIKLTLYRPGGPSRIGDALRRAAGAGKDVSVVVELKARFDEEHNIEWAKSLERAGLHVVTGLVALKTHAKVALVVRRAGAPGHVRRYVHVGTGNYNADSARVYTDLGLFSADDELGADLTTLFNEMTGSARAPRGEFRRLLIAPTNMLARFLALIDREAAHARAGRGGRIRAKLNGLADAQVIGALYRAAQAGVDIDLVVRGLCMLRPGVPGLSERIRVTSILGRFLEHARIYHFANAGDPDYYIGSADWRARNLRRRVEVAVPVRDPAARARLDIILDTELNDPSGWYLNADGSYARAGPTRGSGTSRTPRLSAQQTFIELATARPDR